MTEPVKNDKKTEQNQKLEAILSELFLIDPTLRKDERVLRMIILDMLKYRPELEFDHGFAQHLRDHIMFRSVPHIGSFEKAPPEPHGVLFWTLRFAPLGVLVAVIIMLATIPDPPSGGTPIIPSVPAGNGTESYQLKVGGEDDAADTGRAPETSTTAQPATLEGSVVIHTMHSGPEAIVSVMMPNTGYVAIYADQGGVPGRFLGASRVLPPGPSDNVQVLLSRPAVPGEVLYAELHASNGDTRFDTADPPFYTSAGTPIGARITIIQ